MKKTRSIFVCLAMILVLASPTLSTGTAYAEDPILPSNPEQSWTPPENAGTSFAAPGVKSEFDSSSAPSETGLSSSYYPYQPYRPIVPLIISAKFIDESGRERPQFGNEPFYLRMQINTPGIFYLAEYFPSDSGIPPHWLMYQYDFDRAGTWTLGPFYSDAYEPIGQHTWKMWLWSSGMWAQRLARFDYRPSTITFPDPPFNPVETGGWSTLQMMVVAVLVGALGITTGMLISNKRRYSS